MTKNREVDWLVQQAKINEITEKLNREIAAAVAQGFEVKLDHRCEQIDVWPFVVHVVGVFANEKADA